MGTPELRSQYEQIVEQVRQTKESTLQVDERRFDAPVDRLEGTVKSASFRGVELAWRRLISSTPGPSRPGQHKLSPRPREAPDPPHPLSSLDPEGAPSPPSLSLPPGACT